MALGRWMDAEEAMAYGLVHEILEAAAARRPQGGARRPFGFTPPS